MDFQDLGEFLLMAGVSLSMITIALGFTVRVFLRPIIREFFAQRSRPAEVRGGRLDSVLERIETRLDSLEAGLDRVSAAQDFDRRLGPTLERDDATS